MRGAALKLGQMLSLQDETVLPPAVASALDRVRSQADVMPRSQLEQVLLAELGPDWADHFGGEVDGAPWDVDAELTLEDAGQAAATPRDAGMPPTADAGEPVEGEPQPLGMRTGFFLKPVAAASIGQVHFARLPSGKEVAVKVQYPGVADSIESDLDNAGRLMMMGNLLPKGLFLENIIEVAKEELALECDYRYEAKQQALYRELAADLAGVEVVPVVPDLCTRRVLVTEWFDGVGIDKCGHLPAPERALIGRRLLALTLKELFEWRLMQTDPNWGNFLYSSDLQTVGLIDFGATREYRKEFVDDYLRLVWAAANRDREALLEVSLRLGFLTGHESDTMMHAHTEAGLVVGEPFATSGDFDFRGGGITQRVMEHGSVFGGHRLTPPPPEIYSLHRKLSGAFLICIKLGISIHCRDLLLDVVRNYDFTTPPLEGESSSISADELARQWQNDR